MKDKGLHFKNKFNKGYNFEELIIKNPLLKDFVIKNKYDIITIDFSNPKAVKELNKALLFSYDKISVWDFPDENLCPPIPGRLDYIHHLNDLISSSKEDVNVLDIGTGATCIYPLLGVAEYNWNFVATDIDKVSLKNAQKIIDKNKLNNCISLRHQTDSSKIFSDILNEDERFSISICNPPFYKSEAEALKATTDKLEGLNKSGGKIVRNFSGTDNELWYKGGEKAFIHNYLYESSLFKKQCLWFSTLVSKKELVKGVCKSLKKLGATEIKIIDMSQGNKISRIVAWTFLNKTEQNE